MHEPHGAAVSRGRGSPALRAYPPPATLLPTVQPIPPQAQPSPCHPNLARLHALFRRSCMTTRPVPRRGCRRCTRRAARRGGAAPASLSLRQQEPLPAHPSPLACSCMATRPVPRRGCRRRTRRAACRGGAAPASLSLRRGGGATATAATGEQHGRRVATTLTNAQIGAPL